MLQDLELKQNLMYDAYKIGSYSEFWFDQESSVLQFKNKNVVELEFEVVCIGSWAHKNETLMWSWANPSMTNEIRNMSVKNQGFKGKKRFGYL